MSAVTIRDLGKSFGKADILHGISFDIADGEFAVLVGPSGSGKSTLLRMIAGLESIASGTIKIGGQVVNHLPPAQRDIAMVFQNNALYPHKTVAANIGFALRTKGLPKDEIARRVDQAAEILGLRPYLKRLPRALSGGQRQRVGLGRALVRDPQVFLFDEPLSNLDAKLRVQMRAEIRELQLRLGTTTLYVTHDQVEAMSLADKLVVMQNGRIEQIGTPLDVFDNPASLFVAGFIGSPAMNLINGVYRGAGGRASLGIGDGLLPSPVLSGLADGAAVVVGVRPDKLCFREGGVPGQVQIVEQTGAETRVTVRLHGQEVVAVFHERPHFRAGQDVSVFVEPGNMHVFDKLTGRAVT